jgi:thiol-disulfide isomerase/thioredoxin
VSYASAVTRGVVCLVLVACATPSPQAPKPRTAAEILHETAETYAHAKTYVDHGQQTAVLGSASHVQRRTFTTAFVRDQVFRFEYVDREHPRWPYVIWSTPKQTLTSWVPRPGIEVASDVGDALGTAAGVSGGLSVMIPALLFPRGFDSSIASVANATRARDEAVSGHACWQITGSRQATTVTLWIDMQTHLIRQIEERYRVDGPRSPPFNVDEITRIDPALDGQVDTASVQAPDAHGQPLPPPPREPAWLGVMFDGHGGTTRVQSVVAGGPASHAGLQAGDVITKIDAQSVAKAADVILRVRDEKPGATLHLTLSRGGKEMPLDVTLEKRPDLDELQGRFVGQPAPDFALAAMSGPTSAKLADLKGHVVIVDFWATWCGPCAMAMPHLVDLAHRYKDLRVVGISDEDESDIRAYVAAHKIDYTIARDADDVVTGHYLVTGLPTLVIIDKAGVVRALHVGAGDFDTIEAEVQQYLK